MADDSSIIERLARLEEQSGHFLDRDDAIKLMEHTASMAAKIQKDFVGRLADMRAENREAFRHVEHNAATAIQLLEAKLPNMISTSVSSVLTERFPAEPQRRSGLHPALTYGGGGLGAGATIAVILLYLMTNGAHLGGS